MPDATSPIRRVPGTFRRFRRALFASFLASFLPMVRGQPATTAAPSSNFPALGRRLVFTSPAFRSELHFHSISSLTYHLFAPDGSLRRSEQVEVRIQEIAEAVFLVAWQEASKTTVVQVQDFARKVLFSNITRQDGTFTQVRGTFEVSGP